MQQSTWVGILIFVSCLMAGLAWEASRRAQALRLARRLGQADRLEQDDLPAEAGERLFLRVGSQFAALSQRIAPRTVLEETRRRLQIIGSKISAEQFYAGRLGSTVIALGALLSMSVVGLGSTGILLMWIAGGLAYLGPDIWLTSRVRARQQEAQRQLIGFIDMLTVTMDAGLNLGDALQQVCANMGGVLGHEFGFAYQEMRLGASREVALAAVSGRIGIDDLKTAIQVILEAGRSGVPLAQALRSLADSLRVARQIRAQEVAQKLSVRILLPVVIFILAPMMAIILAPAAVNMMDALGN